MADPIDPEKLGAAAERFRQASLALTRAQNALREAQNEYQAAQKELLSEAACDEVPGPMNFANRPLVGQAVRSYS